MNMKDLKEKFYKFFKDNPLIVKILPFFIIVFIVTGFFWKVVFLNYVPLPGDIVVGGYHPWLDYKWGYPVGVPVKNPITTDVVSFTYPMRTLAIEIIKSGKVPLWNSRILTGVPLLANFQSAPLSLTAIYYFLFDNITAWSFQVITQHILIGIFTYLLLRHWKVSKISSIIAGVAFSFSGFNIIWSQWNVHALSAAFIPLLILFEDRWLDSGNILDAVAFSIILFLQIMSGYPQVVFYSAITLFILLVTKFKKEAVFIKRTTILGIFFLLGLGLSSFQLFPSFELLELSQRAIEPHPFEWAFLPWVKVITFFAPDYFGNHATQNYWGPQDYTSNTGFVGVAAMMLASFSSFLIKEKKKVLFAFLAITLSLLLAFPTPISVLIWKTGIFGMQAASAHRILVIFNFGIAILVGFGADFIKKKLHKSEYPPLVILPFLVLGSFGAYTLINFYLSKRNPEKYISIINNIPFHTVALRNLVIPIGLLLLIFTLLIVWKTFKLNKTAFILVVFGLMIFELFRFGYKFTPFSPQGMVFPSTPVLNFIKTQDVPNRVSGGDVVPINMLMPYGVEIIEGYDAVYPYDIAKYVAVMNSNIEVSDPQGRYAIVTNFNSNLLDIANVKYILAKNRDEKGNPSAAGNYLEIFANEKYKEVFKDNTISVLENKSVLPRYFMVYDWEKEEDEVKLYSNIISDDYSAGKVVYLNKEIFGTVKKGENSVTIKKYLNQESELEVYTENAGILFSSDLYYPGWKAFIDSKETEIIKANNAFRAIYVPSGKHDIKFIYKPDSFKKGLYISIFSLLIIISIPLACILGKKRK